MASNSNTANKKVDEKVNAPLTPKEMGRKGDLLDKLTGSFNFFYHTIPEKAKAAKQKIKELKEGPKSRPDPRLAGLGRRKSFPSYCERRLMYRSERLLTTV